MHCNGSEIKDVRTNGFAGLFPFVSETPAVQLRKYISACSTLHVIVSRLLIRLKEKALPVPYAVPASLRSVFLFQGQPIVSLFLIL